MPRSGRVVFGEMDEVVFGVPAAQAIVAQMDRLGARRAILMVSGTLNRSTDEIEKVRSALGERCVAVFDRMPAHTPRQAVVDAADLARANAADLIVTIGGGSITDGAKAVQLCLANDIRSADDIKRVRSAMASRRKWPRRPCGRSAFRPRSPAASSATSPASPTSAARSRKCCAIPASCRAP
jgi:maleylacetate reductase